MVIGGVGKVTKGDGTARLELGIKCSLRWILLMQTQHLMHFLSIFFNVFKNYIFGDCAAFLRFFL